MRTIISIHKAAGLLALLTLPLLGFGQNDLQYFRPYDKRGLNIFETLKTDNGAEGSFKVRVGGNFSQSYQALDHENRADSVAFTNAAGRVVNRNRLKDLTPGFNLATANLNLDAQLDEGIRVNVITYLSSRRHAEAYVKGGYMQFDRLPFLNSKVVDALMDKVTVRVGHYEVNYGDAHFRRSDNGNAIYNPFMENLILDAFNTEIGGEVVFQDKGILLAGSVTGGEIKGDVVALPQPPEGSADDKASKSPSLIGKIGFDKQVNEDLRLRVTGSAYYTASSNRNVLYAGDRAGSRYYLVLENAEATTDGNPVSGRINPGFTDKVASFMGNMFFKYKGVEFFGTYENANGRSSTEADMRNATQLAGELIFRFGKNENFYVGGRYNTVKAEMSFAPDVPVTVNRIQAAAGWFLNKHILAKVEYMTQEYKDYPTNQIFSEGKFNGLVVEATVAF